MTQFSISAAWYPLWAFTILVFVVLVPLVLPVNAFYRYILGSSAPHWMRRMGLPPSTNASKNESPVENPSRSTGPNPPSVASEKRRLSHSLPINRDVGAVFPQLALPPRQLALPPGQLSLGPPPSSVWDIVGDRRPSKAFEITAAVESNPTASEQIQDQGQKEGKPVSHDLEAQNQSSTS